MSPHSHRPARIAAGTVLLVLAMPTGSAVAGTYTHRDPAGDVVLLSGAGTTTPQPKQRAVDITRTVTAFRGSTVTVSVTLRQIPTTPYSVHWEFRTAQKKVHSLDFDGYSGGSDLRWSYGGAARTCAIGHSVKAARSTVTFLVPRSCLAGTTWVRTGVSVKTSQDGAVTYLVDDGGRTGHPGAHPKLGLKVERD